MKEIPLVIFGLITVIVAFVLLSLTDPIGNTDVSATIRNTQFSFPVVACTNKERGAGLMGYTELDAQTGALFVFDTINQWAFWNKGTLIPLDVIWLDESFIITDIASLPAIVDEDMPTLVTPESRSILYVIELNEGETEKYNIQKGDRVIFDTELFCE